jgi:hypothetical protein
MQQRNAGIVHSNANPTLQFSAKDPVPQVIAQSTNQTDDYAPSAPRMPEGGFTSDSTPSAPPMPVGEKPSSDPEAIDSGDRSNTLKK